MKKGNSSWKPASVTDLVDKDPNYRYRLAYKDSDNIAKKKAEGWEIVDKKTDQVSPEKHNRLNDGSSMDTAIVCRDTILMRMPEETALERDAYYDGVNKHRESALTAHVKNEVGKEGAATHGDITISSRS